MAATVTISGNQVHLQLVGRVTEQEHRDWLTQIEEAIGTYDSWRMLVAMVDFEGFEMESLWNGDLDAEPIDRFERLAVVGDTRTEPWIAAFTQPFTRADVKVFPPLKMADAEVWLEGGDA